MISFATTGFGAHDDLIQSIYLAAVLSHILHSIYILLLVTGINNTDEFSTQRSKGLWNLYEERVTFNNFLNNVSS